MCGIAGFANCNDSASLARMTAVQRHRGPDDEGIRFFPEERVGLGHNRLSIIDLSPAGHQPMSTADDSLCIVFNGEIYNFRELRQELEGVGCRFTSQTDTEVILHLYAHEGSACVRRLNGMFAFALLDRPRQKLVLARDHLGIKPLYYTYDQGRFVFGSEIKAILASGVYTPEINWQGLYDYFTYLYIPCPETLFRGIVQVPPAHVLEFDLRTRTVQCQPYWCLPEPGQVGHSKTSVAEARERLRSLLADSVQRQMISDVPLGVFLSGGIDSPILTGLMAQATSTSVKTFTIVFQGHELQFYNEQAIAREVACTFGTEHHEIPVDITDPMEMLRLVEFFDQPFGNPTFYLMYLISQHTRPEATVALCGAGGDELFAGYPRYKAMALARWLRWVPRPWLKGLRRLLALTTDDYRTMTLRRAREFLDGLDADFVRQFVKWTYFLDAQEKQRLLAHDVWQSHQPGDGWLPSERIVRQCLATSPVLDVHNRVLHLDVQTFLPNNILEYTDKMSMAVSLEVRVPYLDYRVVEHSFTIPFWRKLHRGQGKVFLKDTFADLLPAANRTAPKKGFNVPLALWMRDRLDGYFDSCMDQKAVAQQGILNWDYLQTLRQQHRTGKRDNSYALFAIIMFDVWFRKYMLGREVPAAALPG